MSGKVITDTNLASVKPIFLVVTVGNSEGSSVIKCLCTKCINLSFRTHKVVCKHLYFHGFDVSYTTWSWHGEDVNDTPLPNVDVDVPFEFIDYDDGNTVDMVNDAYRDCAADPKAFKELLEQAEKLCTHDAQISLS